MSAFLPHFWAALCSLIPGILFTVAAFAVGITLYEVRTAPTVPEFEEPGSPCACAKCQAGRTIHPQRRGGGS